MYLGGERGGGGNDFLVDLAREVWIGLAMAMTGNAMVVNYQRCPWLKKNSLRL